jgi:hypothetical protein
VIALAGHRGFRAPRFGKIWWSPRGRVRKGHLVGGDLALRQIEVDHGVAMPINYSYCVI